MMKKYIAVTLTLAAAMLLLGQASVDQAHAGSPALSGRTLYMYGETRDAEKVDILVAVLNHENRHKRRIAARALGKIGDSKATMPLIEVLLSPNEDNSVKEVAAWALGAINSEKALEPLSCCMENNNHRVKRQAMKAYIKIAKK